MSSNRKSQGRTNNKIKELLVLAKTAVEQKPFKIDEFIELIFQMTSVKEACGNVENSYLIALVGSMIYDKLNTSQSMNLKYLPSSARFLLDIATVHATGKGLSDDSLIISYGKYIFKEIETLLKQNLFIDQSISTIANMLNLIQILSFELVLFALKNIKILINFTNVFQLFINQRAPFLPNFKQYHCTLVFDLDETLGHSVGNFFFPRPGVQLLLESLSSKYELVLFTSAEETYATNALKIIDPKCLIKFRLFRQHLVNFEQTYVKDLSVLGRDLTKTIIIDDRPQNFKKQPENGLKISPWTGDSEDRELFKLQHLLLNISSNEMSNLVETLKQYHYLF